METDLFKIIIVSQKSSLLTSMIIPTSIPHSEYQIDVFETAIDMIKLFGTPSNHGYKVPTDLTAWYDKSS
jgi:hypothetical protein